MKRNMALAVTACAGIVAPQASLAQDADDSITEITVTERRVANTRPAGTYASPATVLRFDPATELQSRGLAEGQADVTVLGGVFENTGFKAGAVTIMDPQTGHYVAELPIDPALLTMPVVLTGIDNTLAGFNSNIATIVYSLAPIADGGVVLAGAGSDSLQFQSIHWAQLTSTDAGEWGAALSAARSQGDGSLPNGDHEFERYNVHLQRRNMERQSDLLFSYQDKFYGWPGAYTGFATLAETDHTKTLLLLGNHRTETDSGAWEAGAFYRRLEDDYDFDRTTQESGAPGSFDHETRVYGLGFQGTVGRGSIDWRYAGQLTSDELVYSTDLTNGDFDSRSYGSLSIVPTLALPRRGDRDVELRVGASTDWSSRDSSAVSPVLGATIRRNTTDGSRYLDIEYAATSQLPGYTALKSGPSGLFGGNVSLGREKARQFSLSLAREAADWSGRLSIFYRQDDNLVDWTYSSASPFARQANPVDIDVAGLQGIFSRNWESVDVILGYTFLDKDADYGSAAVDASFYALNFARHRATLALRYRFAASFELRFDNEYRLQEENPLRSSSDTAFLSSAALAWEPGDGEGFGVVLTADNLTDDDYQQFPGTPAVGRQVSLSARYAW